MIKDRIKNLSKEKIVAYLVKDGEVIEMTEREYKKFIDKLKDLEKVTLEELRKMGIL